MAAAMSAADRTTGAVGLAHGLFFIVRRTNSLRLTGQPTNDGSAASDIFCQRYLLKVGFMPRLRGSIPSMSRFRRHWQGMFGLPASHTPGWGSATWSGAGPGGTARLHEVASFGDNPGNLRMLAYVPPLLASGGALVVALHGCGQSAEDYDRGTGWSRLAERHGFALLLPEQRRANNHNGCFNWFEPGDIGRDQGEAASIQAMVARMIALHGLDPKRVTITGLSAGGAMTAVMLAGYPEMFRGGAVIAGLPYGCASTVHEALDCMFNGHPRPAERLGARARAAAGHRGAWPTLSVWHGSADTTVHPDNAGELVKQWTDLHGLSATPSVNETVAGCPRQAWLDADGRVLVESITVPGMGHGVPLRPARGETDLEGCGEAGAYMLDVGVSSTRHIAAGWGLVPAPAVARRPAADVKSGASTSDAPKSDAPKSDAPQSDAPKSGAAAILEKMPLLDKVDVGGVISAALRNSGLLR
jgi:feruloyl esterase